MHSGSGSAKAKSFSFQLQFPYTGAYKRLHFIAFPKGEYPGEKNEYLFLKCIDLRFS
jgi:hypothetical protein